MERLLVSTMRRGRLLILGLCLLSTACRSMSGSDVEESEETVSYKTGNTVLITPPRDQGPIGFCWSYGTMALLESLHLTRTGESIVLSPEAFGFYHYVNLLKAYFVNEEQIDRLIVMMTRKEGNLDANIIYDRAEYSSPPILLKAYGVVPESVYVKKFPVSMTRTSDADLFHRGLLERINLLIATKGKSYLETMSEDDIIKEVMVSPDPSGYTAAPPTSFTFKGKTYTPRSFLKDYLKVDPSALTVKVVYPELEESRASNVDQLSLSQFISYVNRNLAAGIPMPFRVDIDIDRLSQGVFTTVPLASAGTPPPAFTSIGGHLMLLIGPTRQPLDATENQDRLIVKNSWGSSLANPSLLPSDGLYLMEIGYIREMLKEGYFLGALMPKVIGKAPFIEGIAPFNRSQ